MQTCEEEGIGRLQPQNIQAEEAILCCCLESSSALKTVMNTLVPQDFYKKNHEMIFATMMYLSQQNEPVDIITVSDFLTKNGKITEVGGTSYISRLTDSMAMTANAAEYAQIVLDKSERRKVISTLDRALGSAYNAENHVSSVIDCTVAELKKNKDNRDETGLVDIATYYPSEETSFYIPTGFETLDRLTDGFSGGMYTVITGKRGTGKSTFASQIALSAIDSGYNVCFYSGELSKKMFQEWLWCQAAGQNNVEQFTGQNGALRHRAIKTCEIKIRKWLTGKLYLYDNSVRKGSEHNTIIDRFTYAATEKGCKLFFVDNLKSAKFKESTERDFYRKQAMFVQDLLEFAHEFDVHVILMAHPNKSDVSDINDGIAGSSDITDLASNIFRIDRLEGTEKTRENADAALTVSKNRDLGTNARIPLMYDIGSRRYTNRDAKTKTNYGWEKINDWNT